MAEPEKGNSLTGKDKGKMSHLEEDISKDFLTSWKSISLTGGDDMDFNFEPVTKGNKKAFDFGKLDMDFSLDGEFAKLSSFKLDMPDLDFSSSPKKSTKSNEKSEDESIKENRPAKKNEFTFSFDFNELDYFSLDAPSTKGGNNPSREKTSKEVGSMIGIGCDESPRQFAKANKAPKDTDSKRPSPVSEDAPNSKSKDLVNSEGGLDALPKNYPSNSEIVENVIQPKGTQVSPEEAAANAQNMDHQSLLSDKTSDEFYGQGTVDDSGCTRDTRSTSAPVLMESAKAHVPLETKITMASQGNDKEIQAIEETSKLSYAGLEVQDLPAVPLLAKTSIQAALSEGMDVCSSDVTLNDVPSESCIVTGTRPAAAVLALDAEKVKPEKFSEQLLTDKRSSSDEKNDQVGDVASSGGKLAFNNLEPPAPSVLDTLSSDARYHAEPPRSTSKFFSPTFGRLSI